MSGSITPGRPRIDQRRPLAFGLLASAAIHVAVLTSSVDVVTQSQSSNGTSRVLGSDVQQLLHIRHEVAKETIADDAWMADEVNAAPESQPAQPSQADVIGGAQIAEDASARAHQFIVPNVRLSNLPLMFRSATEVAEARVAAAVVGFNDSIAEIARRGHPTDWSVTTVGGRRWGVSPGAIHLGSRTLSPCKVLLDPFTCQFRVPDAQRRETREWVEMHREIQLQAARIEGERVLHARIRAMELRRNATRDTIRR